MRAEIDGDPTTWRRTSDLSGETTLWLSANKAGEVRGGASVPLLGRESFRRAVDGPVEGIHGR